MEVTITKILQPPTTTPTCTSRYGIVLTTQRENTTIKNITPTCTSRYGVVLTTHRENTTIKNIEGIKWRYLEPCHEKHHVQHL
jgi:hypothetical protein